MQERIHHELILDMPEGFHYLDARPSRALPDEGREGGWGMQSEDLGITITVLWQQRNPLLVWLADMKAMARRNEMDARRSYRDHGYQRKGFFSMRLDGKQAEGYSFTFSLKDVNRYAETVLVKHRENIYNITCFGNEQHREADRALFQNVLSSVCIG